MIKCKKCNRDKNFNDYYVTGRGMNAICKPCLKEYLEKRKDD